MEWTRSGPDRAARNGQKKTEKKEMLQDLGDLTSTPYMTGLYGHIHVK